MLVHVRENAPGGGGGGALAHVTHRLKAIGSCKAGGAGRADVTGACQVRKGDCPVLSCPTACLKYSAHLPIVVI